MRLVPIAWLAPLAAALAACASPATQPQSASAPPPAGLVSAADPRAAAAGAEILRAGGNAVDAAIATLVALNVVEPQSSGIGGGGFMLYDDGRGHTRSFDGRETAPMAAGGDWFIFDGKVPTLDEAIPGGRSVGVPGNVRLMALAHRQHGRLPWSRLFAPAIRLARDGFVVTRRLNDFLNRYPTTGAMTATGRALYYGADGKALPVGTRIRNPALALTLEQLAARGPDSFYVGPNAQVIVNTVNGADRHPSNMSLGDLASYQAKERPPLCGSYRGYRICGMGPPSSGGSTVFAILKQLERFDLAALGPNSPTSWHLLAESMRLAYADRDKYLADPDFVKVPIAGLSDPAYLARRSALISPVSTMATVAAGVPAGATELATGRTLPEYGTTHFVVVDRWGAVVSETSTIEGPFGPGLMANGYFLNNELTDFSLVPTVGGVAVANRVEGGKRPRSSTSPTIVYGPDGHVRLALGAAGGATIIAQVAKAIIGVIDWKLSAQQAIALPVLFAPGDTVFVERGTYLEAMAPRLEALGHQVKPRDPGFKANAIEWVGNRWVGAADPRSEGEVARQ